MLTKDKKKLEIFEKFQYLDRPQKKTQAITTLGDAPLWVTTSSSTIGTGTSLYIPQIPVSIIEKVKHVSKELLNFVNVMADTVTKSALKSKSMKKFCKKLNLLQKQLDSLEYAKQLEVIQQVRENAERTHQKAFLEQLEEHLERINKELQLISNGFNIIVTEEDMVTLVNKFDHEVFKLTWITNFTKIIPHHVYERYLKAEETKIFDNYVILHLDRFGTVAKTKKQIEEEKDPILFGVFKESRRLYFIGDWIDDYCDLTLTDLLGRLAKDKADELNSTVMLDFKRVTSVEEKDDTPIDLPPDKVLGLKKVQVKKKIEGKERVVRKDGLVYYRKIRKDRLK